MATIEQSKRAKAIIALRKLVEAPYLLCKEALELTNYDMEAAKVKVIELQQAKMSTREAELHYGVVITDSKTTVGEKDFEDVAVLLCLACQSPQVEKTDDFIDAADQILLTAMALKPLTIGHLLTCDLAKPILIKTGREDATTFLASTVDDLITMLRIKYSEAIEIKHYRILQTKDYPHMGISSVYNHSTGKAAGIAIGHLGRARDKFNETLLQKVLAVATCYNPLCIHEHNLPEYVIKRFKQDVLPVVTSHLVVEHTSVKPELIFEAVDQEVKNFKKSYVLDTLNLPEFSFLGQKIPETEIQKILAEHHLEIYDFERYKLI